MAQTGEPEASIGGGAENQLCVPKCRKGTGDVMRAQVGNVTTDQCNRARVRQTQKAGHARAKIAVTLRNAGQVGRPKGALKRGVGRYGENGLPARIINHAQQPRNLMAEPPGGRDHSDIVTQPGFDPACNRGLDHDDQTRTPVAGRA